MKIFSGVDIPAASIIGVRHGPIGRVTNVQYKTKSNGRISFYESGWQEFLTGKRELRLDTLVISTIRKSSRNDFQMMVAVDHV
uniref:Uncharacterized protein n=1 Tax=Triticum urartu TaxID=4572 RepID=A0A8R7TZI9_TRIUA